MLIFNYLKKSGADIIFLQETHCQNDTDVKIWTKEWEGKAIWSTFSNKIDVVFEHIDIDKFG